MKTIARPTIMSEIAGQWQQAIRGNNQAREALLRRITPVNNKRPR